MGLSNLSAGVNALIAANNQLIADAQTAADVAEDQAINPPATPPATT